MKHSAGSVVITAPIGIPLAGNGRADAASRGIHDDLRANIIYLESGGTQLLLIGLDLLGLRRGECNEMKARIQRATGIPAEHMNILCTHTHSGPNTMRVFANLLTQQDLERCDTYLQWLVDTVSQKAIQVVAEAAEGLMGYGQDVAEGFSFGRRVVLRDGSLKMVFEDYDRQEIDYLACPNGNPILSVAAFTDLSRNVRALLVHFTSHPAIVCGEDWLYTRDYVDELTVQLQRRFGRDVTVLYANGAQGNQVAADPYLPFTTGWEEAKRVGGQLAHHAKTIVSRLLMEKALVSQPELHAKTATVTLPIRQITQAEIRHANELMQVIPNRVQLHGLDPRVEATSILEMAEYPLTEETVPIQALRLGPLCAVSFPGEVFLEFGLEVMNSDPRDVVIFGLSNDYIGYLPTEVAFSQGGYEIKTSVGSSRFAPQAGKLLAEACRSLLAELP